MGSVDSLGTIAEISIALAGFGGIVAGLGYRAGGEWTHDDRLRLIMMARVSIVIVFACLLPTLLSHFTSSIWRVSSALVLVPTGYFFAWQVWLNRRGVPAGYSRGLAWLVGANQLTIVLLLAAGSLGFTRADPEGYYLAAVLLMLLSGSTLFLRLLTTSFRGNPPAA